MPGKDDDLLARLNALKPSSVNLDSRPKASVDVEVHRPQTVEDKLADRLKALRSGGVAAASSNVSRVSDADALAAQVKDEVATESDPTQDWQQGGEDEQSLEELLAELGPDDQWKLDPDDPKNIDSLLKAARGALPTQEEPEVQEKRGTDQDHDWVKVDADNEEDGDEESRHEAEDKRDEEAADEYVKRVLAELEVDEKYREHDDGKAAKEGMRQDDGQAGVGLALPSTPSNLPQPPATPDPPTYEDSELESRFSKLGLDLPSTPSAPPSSKPKVTASIGGAKAKPKTPAYTDEDIESWCCICNEDGEVRCLGCDGDIYCQQCWREGHGKGPGQERGHRAVQFVRKGGGGATAA